MFATFEGPEKKLEVILRRPIPDLRENTDGRWDKVVADSGAHVISRVGNERLDAYLLSESSLFVWDDRILMITCGRTTLVEAVPRIIEIVNGDSADGENVAFLFYEQKNFLFPHKQPSTFEADVARLSALAPGRYYSLGPLNFDHVKVFYSFHADDRKPPDSDATFQMLMHDMDPAAMAPFCKGDGPLTPEEALRRSGIEAVSPLAMTTDGYLFSPCGYSLNGIHEDRYVTVHVTPQAGSSYASFETNLFEADYAETIQKVVRIFRPGRFSLVLTTSMDDACMASHETIYNAGPGYAVKDKSFYEFECGYGVSFLNFTRGRK